MMRRHAELLCEHMGEERGCKEFRKHVSWYLKGFAAGGELRRSLALVDCSPALDALLAELDPDEPFPVAELGTPRGRQGSPRARVVLPEGWLDDTDGSGSPRPRGRRARPPAGDVDGHVTAHPGSAGDSDPAVGLCFTRCVVARFVTSGSATLLGQSPCQQQQRISAVAISHKRDTNARRKPKAALVAGPLALLATGSAVAVGVLASDPEPERRHRARSASTASVAASVLASRRDVRLACRARAWTPRRLAACARRAPARTPTRPARPPRRPSGSADTRRWTTAPLNLWTAPGKDADEARPDRRPARRSWSPAGATAAASRSSSTARPRWVTAGYLADEKPVAAAAAAPSARVLGRFRQQVRGPGARRLSTAPAPTAPRCERGQPQRRHGARGRLRAPSRRSRRTATFRGDGEHAQGLAIDIMVSGSPRPGGRGLRAGPLLRARRQRHHLLAADLDGRALRRGLARHGGPRVAPPPTTTTTCTSRRTERGRVGAARPSAAAQ